MEDFGDFIGQQGQQFTSQMVSQAMMELRMMKRYDNQYAENVSDATRDAQELRARIDSGDLLEVESNTFDLSGYDEYDRPLVLQSLKETLAKKGFDPAGLVPITPEDGGSPARWVFTFSKDDATRFSEVLDGYLELAFEKYGLKVKAGLEDSFYLLDGFGSLTKEQREEFKRELDAILDSGGKSAEKVIYSRNADGSLAGDLSIPLDYKEDVKRLCEKFTGEYGQKFYLSYSLLPADAVESFDQSYAEAKELGVTLMRNGYDGRITVTQSGSCLLSIDPDEAPKIMDIINSTNAMKQESAIRKARSERFDMDGPKPAKSLLNHAKEASAAQRRIAEQGRDFSRKIGETVSRVIKGPLP